MTQDLDQDRAAALMGEIAHGDRRALADLIALEGRGLTLLARRYLGNPEEAEEVVQDVFLRVWRHAGRYDPARAKVRTWLYRIAVNLCIDRQRKRALWRFVGLEEGAHEVPDHQPSAAETLAGRQRLAQVRDQIARLPNRQRMALLLSAVAGLGTAEIAAALGTSPGAAEQLLVRARRTLRAATDGNGREP
ncbi:MAG: sigma-70 family RNA polymerase sigma factor [Pseudomonadota bacterium]